MSNNQRSFAQKLSKMYASDVRKNAINCTMGLENNENTLMDNNSMFLLEPVEPVDYEEFLIEHVNLIKTDTLKYMLDFPSDDVAINTIPRSIRTKEHILPKQKISELPRHVRECIEYYIRPWKVVQHNYRRYSSSYYQPERIINYRTGSMQPQEFEIDQDLTHLEASVNNANSNSNPPSSRHSVGSLSSVGSGFDTATPRVSWASFDLRRSVNDPLIPLLLNETTTEEMDKINASKREENREGALFVLYPESDPEDFIERRLTGEMPVERMGHRILIKCLQLRLELEIEPIFASMALYDLKEKRKISENFYFDMNSDSLRHMLSSHVSYCDSSTQSKMAIFNINNFNNDLFLVVRLEKVLQGDIKDSLEPYLKEDKDKYRDKVKLNASDFCERLGKYRMPFAWSAIYLKPIFNGDYFENKDGNFGTLEKEVDSISSTVSSNSLDRKLSINSFDQLKRKASDISSNVSRRGSLDRKEKGQSWSSDDFAHAVELFHPTTIIISNFYKQEADKLKDEDLYRNLVDIKKPGLAAKKYKCIPGCLQLEISPCPTNISKCLTTELYKVEPYPEDNAQPIKEILEFSSSEDYNSHYSYRNLLFIYPKELNFSSRVGSARNIAVRVQIMAGETASDAMNAIFGKSSCPEYANEQFSIVNYHNKCPTFYDEIKIALPANLNQNHHLFFTIYHVSCQKKSHEIQSSVESPIGYTWLPLLDEGTLQVGEFQLPVMVEPPPDNYSFISPNVQLPGTKWLDNHRPIFTINVQAVTSIHTLDPHLDNFFLMCEYLNTWKLPAHIRDCNMEVEMKKYLLDIEKADKKSLIKNLNFIFDKLIELLVCSYTICAQKLSLGATVFEVLCAVASNLATANDDFIYLQYERHPLLLTYAQFQCKIPNDLSNNSKTIDVRDKCSKEISANTNKSILGSERLTRLLHEELALHWVVCSGHAAELAMRNSWFLFELMLKSMYEYLHLTSNLTCERKKRFSHQYKDDLCTLVHLVTTKVVDYHSNEPKFAQQLNASLAFFIFDLFSIMDRGFVFNLIKIYYKVIVWKNPSEISDMIGYIIDFLRIFCSHEHYIPLNLPFGKPYFNSYTKLASNTSIGIATHNNTFSLYGSSNNIDIEPLCIRLNVDFRRQHFLLGLVLGCLTTAIKMQNHHLHGKVINCVRCLLTSHDLDPRYHNQRAAKERVALLYIPLLGITLDVIPQLHQFITDSSYGMCVLDDYQGPHATKVNSEISPEVAYAISGINTFSPATSLNHRKTISMLNSENTRNLLICFIWVLKNLEKNTLYRWLIGLEAYQIHQVLQILNTCIACFEYKGKKRLPIMKYHIQNLRKSNNIKEKLEECIRGTNSARNDLINRRKDRTNSSEKLRWRKDQKSFRSQFYENTTNTNLVQNESHYYTEGSLATEIMLIVLDTLEVIVQAAMNFETHHNLLNTILKVLLHALSRNQSTLSLTNFFSSQRSLTFKFPSLLFDDEENDICGDLCLLLLKRCGSQITEVRSQSAASLYLLMKQNFKIGNNFARVKMEVTMSLSSLVGTSSAFSDHALRRALKTILVYSETDADMQGSSFPEQVQDLLFNLHMILSDTVKMKEYQEDPEMLMDLMHRIAKGYQNNPDLRLTWLLNMAKKHRDLLNHTEAAMCFIHSAALVSEYLSMLDSQSYMPIGAISFQKITPNALLESAVSDDVLSPGEDGICLGNHFTESGLKLLLEEAANCFQIAGMYEPMNEVYKILSPIYEANREFQKLGKIHGKLQEAFNRIAQLQGKRVLGTYFRVAFYGGKFGDLDQQEFVYKEPTLTKLPEIFNRLQNFYAERFGADSVQIIKDSNIVDVNSLDPSKAYIQITYVEPYFETYEFRHRETYFERNFNLKQFMFATPYTKSGKSHGNLNEQCKRKTILTTANYFPYVKTRIQVVGRQQYILEPIEVAIEDIQKKTLELKAATNQEPADPKILQMVLQGCIGTTVNQGPMEMAMVFLQNLVDGVTVPTKYQNKLRLCFKEFSKRCSDALKKNRNLILADQKDYQRELERNNDCFLDRILPLITLSKSQIEGIIKNNAGNYRNNTPLKW